MELMYEDETYAIKGAVFKVYKTMGAGFPARLMVSLDG